MELKRETIIKSLQIFDSIIKKMQIIKQTTETRKFMRKIKVLFQ